MRDSTPRPPGPDWGSLAASRRRRRDYLGMLTEVAAGHPRIAYVRLLNKPVYLVSDPELARELLVARARAVKKGRGFQRAATPFLGAGLLTNEGEVHRRHRRLLQPAFHKERVRAYGDLMVAATLRLPWTEGGRVDITEEMGRLTLAIVAGALFGADLADAQMQHARASLNEFVANFNGLQRARLPGLGRRHAARSRERFDAVVTQLLRRQHQEETFLAMLLDSVLSDVEILDEARAFVTAGHESTANMLVWALWRLHRHAGVADRLHAEVDALPDTPTTADYPRLPYTRAVAAESLRLYPPLYVLGRRAREPFTLDGWPVQAGDRLLTSPWVIHRDVRWWGPDATRFRPERWLDSAGQFAEHNPGQPRAAYFPFGVGPRVCIGEAFGWLEAVLVIATLARQWRPVIGREPRPRPSFTLRTDGPVIAQLQRRTAADRAALS